MAEKIKSISFLFKDERVVVETSIRGTFRIPIQSKSSRPKTLYKNLTAKEVVEHHIIREGDPVLTLNSGEKIRVYQGGDSSYLPAMVEGILNKHDEREKTHRSLKKMTEFNSRGPLAEEQYEFPWEDLCDDHN